MRAFFLKNILKFAVFFSGLGVIATVYAVDSSSVIAPQNVFTPPQPSYILYVSPFLNTPNKPNNTGTAYYYIKSPKIQSCRSGYSACVNLAPYDSNDFIPVTKNVSQDICAGNIDQIAVHYSIGLNKDPSTAGQSPYNISYEYQYYVKNPIGPVTITCQNYGGNFYYTITCVRNEYVNQSARVQQTIVKSGKVVNVVGPICV